LTGQAVAGAARSGPPRRTAGLGGRRRPEGMDPGGKVIIGVGIDVTAVDRFEESLRRTPRLARRLFNDTELHLPDGQRRSGASLAARFAAKEALAKALGAPGGLSWTDAEVVSEDTGRPRLRVRGSVAARAAELGVRGWHVSLSHDAGIASAVVIAEG
jgi:holo-[acyl-carrier protein] synthase